MQESPKTKKASQSAVIGWREFLGLYGFQAYSLIIKSFDDGCQGLNARFHTQAVYMGY